MRRTNLRLQAKAELRPEISKKLFNHKTEADRDPTNALNLSFEPASENLNTTKEYVLIYICGLDMFPKTKTRVIVMYIL